MVLHRFGRASSRDDRLMFSEARPAGESGRGLPHSKTLARQLKHRCGLREVLECASPLALWSGRSEWTSGSVVSEAHPVAESGRGLPHSKTLARQRDVPYGMQTMDRWRTMRRRRRPACRLG